jgi:hypothetical protein
MSKQSQRRKLAKIEAAKAEDARAISLCCPLSIDAAAEGEGKNKPRRFTMEAYSGGPGSINNYGPPAVVNIRGMRLARKQLPSYFGHDRERIVGHTDKHDKTDGTRFVASGVISGATEFARQVLESHDAGFPWQASISVLPEKTVELAEGKTMRVNGQTVNGPAVIAMESVLQHIAFVPEGADVSTSVNIAASAAHSKTEVHSMDFAKWVEALGFDLEALTDAQKVALQAKYDAEVKAAAKAGDGKRIDATANGSKPKPTGAPAPTFDLSAVVLACEKHTAAIQAETAGYTGKIEAGKLAELSNKAGQAAAELKAKALNEEWPATRVEVEAIKAASAYKVELIQAELPKAPAIHASSRDTSPQVIECAFCRTAGLANAEKVYKPEVMEAADRFRGLGLQEMLLMFAAQNGYSGRMALSDGNLREVMQLAFSTHTITTLLTSAGGKFLLEGFNAAPQTWREVGRVRNVTDFKQVTAFRLTASLEYEELPPSGEIRHGSMGQESYTLQAKTYAKMLSLTRPDIINDDLGAFDDLRTRLGMGAVLAMNKRFWTVWLAAVNAGTFWTGARGNYQSGAGTALSEAALNAAVQLFRDAKGPDGNQLGLEPDRLLVPSTLEATGRKIYVSQEMRDTTASKVIYTANTYQNRFRPVVVPQLSSDAYTGYSLTHWWLACDPAVLASAAMCFLNGVQTPTIESSDVDFDQLGIQLRGYHDFGVSMTEYRASVLSAGV